MAVDHLQPGQVGDVRPLGEGLASARSGALFKTSAVEVVRLVMPRGKTIPEHKAPGEIIVQCLEGRVAFTAMGKTEELPAGRLLFLAAAEPHALQALEDSSVLVTLVLNGPEAAKD